ncbi:putative Cystatin domain-containing protein [Medicago truncatula]|uniref:Cystatin domain protein n=1 Tax=Medicago truncatula TaxID=3880 RepID=A0A072TKY9_MEDTR|nr:cystatin domain protein [Medicago truncatula]RHN39062.1 putative Cystatin domain-containing protein [Medicago truncatula]
MRFQSFVIILVVLFASTTINQAKPIYNNNQHLIKVANFAVTEYNMQNTEAKLVFEKVTNGASDVNKKKGTKYSLTLCANNGSTSNNYAAIVLEKPSDNFILKAFSLIHDHDA